MKIKLLIVLFVVTISLSSCIRYEESIMNASEASETSALVLGFFSMNMYYKKNIVAVLQNTTTGRNYYVLFQTNPRKPNYKGALLLALPEGSYKIDAFMTCPSVRSLFTIEKIDCTKHMDSFEKIEKIFTQEFTIKKGTITYIGTFKGQSYGTNGGKKIHWEIDATMESKDDINDYLRSVFPSFTSFPIINAFHASDK